MWEYQYNTQYMYDVLWRICYCPFVRGNKSAVQLYRYQTDYLVLYSHLADVQYDIGYTHSDVFHSSRSQWRYQGTSHARRCMAHVRMWNNFIFFEDPRLRPLSCFKTFVASYPLDATKQITHTTFHEDDTIFHYVRMFRWFDRLFGTISTSTTTTTT